MRLAVCVDKNLVIRFGDVLSQAANNCCGMWIYIQARSTTDTVVDGYRPSAPSAAERTAMHRSYRRQLMMRPTAASTSHHKQPMDTTPAWTYGGRQAHNIYTPPPLECYDVPRDLRSTR